MLTIWGIEHSIVQRGGERKGKGPLSQFVHILLMIRSSIDFFGAWFPSPVVGVMLIQSLSLLFQRPLCLNSRWIRVRLGEACKCELKGPDGLLYV